MCTKLHRDKRQDKEETKALSADLCHSIVELGATANDHSWSGRVGHPVTSSTNRIERTDEAFTRLSCLRLNNCFPVSGSRTSKEPRRPCKHRQESLRGRHRRGEAADDALAVARPGDAGVGRRRAATCGEPARGGSDGGTLTDPRSCTSACSETWTGRVRKDATAPARWRTPGDAAAGTHAAAGSLLNPGAYAAPCPWLRTPRL